MDDEGASGRSSSGEDGESSSDGLHDDDESGEVESKGSGVGILAVDGC